MYTKSFGVITSAKSGAPARSGNVNHSPRKGGRTAYVSRYSGKFPSDFGANSPRFGTEPPPWLRQSNG